MTSAEALKELESIQDLYLREVSKPTDYSLKLLVGEANETASGSPNPTFNPSAVGKKHSPVESVIRGRSLELYWPSYAAYLVTEKSVGSNAQHGYDDESYTGRILRLYSKSHFLDHIAQDTGGHPGTVLHYKLICLNHLIDVAAYAPPEARVVVPAAGKRLPASRNSGGIIGPY